MMKNFEYYIEIFYYLIIIILFGFQLLLALGFIICAENFCEVIPAILIIMVIYKFSRYIISGKFKKGF